MSAQEFEIRQNTDPRPLDIQVEDLRRQVAELKEIVLRVIMAAGGEESEDMGAAHPGEASHLAFVERTKRRR